MPDSTPSFCANCGSALISGNAFCEQCGQPIIPVQPPRSAAKTSSHWGLVFLLIVVITSLGGSAAILWHKMRKTSDGSQSPATMKPPPSNALQPSDQILPSAPDTTSSSGPLKNTPQPLPLTSDKPPTPNEPVGVISTNVRSPADVAYVHFLDEVQRRRRGKISVGSPRSSPTRVEVAVTAEGTTEILVVLEKTNTGTQATVVVGPKDAGAIRSYTLKREADGWVISSFQDLDQ